jgi:hypothetical protein
MDKKQKYCNCCMQKRDITDFYKGRSMCKGCVSFKRYITKYMDSYTKKGMELSFNRLLNECHNDIALVISTQPSPDIPSPTPGIDVELESPTKSISPIKIKVKSPAKVESPKPTKIDMIMTVEDVRRLVDDDIKTIRTYYNTLNTDTDRNDFIDKNIKPEDREYFTKYIVNKYFKPYLNV